ncbi:MAG: hypothetical protein MJ229_03595 [bacterium]|nr:hypothetical protein [bacterium]
MAFTICSKNNEKTFTDKELVNIGSKADFDFLLDLGFEYLLTVQYDAKSNKCVILNQFNNEKFLFKGKPLPARLDVDKICKIMVADSDEFITIKIIGDSRSVELKKENLTEEDIKELYGSEVNAAARLKIEKRKGEIEQARISIIKEVSSVINDLKHKISMNSKGGIVLHFALLFASFICSFGVSNYLMGLPLSESMSVIQMPTNLKLIILFAVIIFGIGTVLKQGVCLFLQNKAGLDTTISVIAERFMIMVSVLFFVAVYVINVLYYMTPKTIPVFAVLISLFFTAITATLAVACGYFKFSNIELSQSFDNFEYREDFERVVKEYQNWIEKFVNNLSPAKIRNIKDKLFMIQLKTVGEIMLGILTAPFLAYGVSNTLAMCFPEAAGWIRVSGLRFSPIFLVLATVMIIFSFFSFVNAFTCNRKIQASNVLKTDGFSNYLVHGVEIFGLEGIRKLNVEMRQSFTIAIMIIVIEFSMNISYFMQEIGGDLGGIILSILAALVPTAILIAETYMLSATKFETFACEELLEKID